MWSSPHLRASSTRLGYHFTHTDLLIFDQQQFYHDVAGLSNCRLRVGADCHFRRHRRRQERHENPALPQFGMGRLSDDHLNGKRGLYNRRSKSSH